MKPFVLLQYCLPHHTLSRLVGFLASSKNKRLKNILIRMAMKRFNIVLDEAKIQNIDEFSSFNDFFTRELKADARPYPEDQNAIVSPVDGTISQIGHIKDGRIFQAKGKFFNLYELTAGEGNDLASYKDGSFTTIYLSPKDYHRVHTPAAGKLVARTHIPGRLFSVNPVTTDTVPSLFARNERVAFHFESEQGPFCVIMVGAMLVASIETPFDGIITPPTKRDIEHHVYQEPIQLARGGEIGRFRFGSTAVVLFPKGRHQFCETLSADDILQLGQAM